jgi:hypothetical protein
VRRFNFWKSVVEELNKKVVLLRRLEITEFVEEFLLMNF